MTRYALVVGGVVSNIVVADADWIAAHAGDFDEAVHCAPDAAYRIGEPLVPPPVDLAVLREIRFAEIDERTEALIAAGFATADE